MSMLIIGNGFDLAHGRPTKYEHFLQFLKLIQYTRHYFVDERKLTGILNSEKLNDYVKQFILSAFQTRIPRWNANADNKVELIQELYICLEENVWYEYFQDIQIKDKMRGKNWIDFENEIRKVIEFFDRAFEDLYEPIKADYSKCSGFDKKISTFLSHLNFSEYNNQKGYALTYENTCLDFVEKTYQDLEKLIRCLEIYLNDCVEKIPITYYSLDILNLKVDTILSFNYTMIPKDIYPSLEIPTHHIHGLVRKDGTVANNNMVLGVDEYWGDSEKNFQTSFNSYKKFVQRIIKETGIAYKWDLEFMASEYIRYEDALKRNLLLSHQENHVFIFGHSLNNTDGDVLREVIRTRGVITTIFYRNKQQQANQIANLIKVLGQDELLTRTFSTSPTIIFQQQAEMVKIATL